MSEEIKTTFITEFLVTGEQKTQKATYDMSEAYNAYAAATKKAITESSAMQAAFRMLTAEGKSASAAFKILLNNYITSTEGLTKATQILQRETNKDVKEVSQLTNVFGDLVVGGKAAASSITKIAMAEKLVGVSSADLVQAQNRKIAADNAYTIAKAKLTRVQEDNTASQQKAARALREFEKATVEVSVATDEYNRRQTALASAIRALDDTALGQQRAFRQATYSAADYVKVLEYLRTAEAHVTKQLASGTLEEHQAIQAAQEKISLTTRIIALEKEQAAAVSSRTTAEARATAVRRVSNSTSGAVSAAAVKQSAGGITGFLAGGIGSTEGAFIANLRRMSIVSPQLAGLTTVFAGVSGAAALTTLGILAVAAATVKITTESIKAAAAMQKYQVTLQALATTGWDVADSSAAAQLAIGKAVSGDMQRYAAESIYALDKIAEGTEKLVGYGIDMRIVNKEMAMLGDLALGDSKRLENLAVAYGQVFGQGKARAQEMYQFVNAGIPIFELLAQKMGKHTSEIMDMTRNGEISFKIVHDLLKDITAEGGKYYNLMKSIADLSYEGNLTKFSNEMQLMFARIGDNILPTLTDLLIQINAALAKWRKTSERNDVIDKWDRRSSLGEYGRSHIWDATGTATIKSLIEEDALARQRSPQYIKLRDLTEGIKTGNAPAGDMYKTLRDMYTVGSQTSFGGMNPARADEQRTGSMQRLADFLGTNFALTGKDIKELFREYFYQNAPSDKDLTTLIKTEAATKLNAVTEGSFLTALFAKAQSRLQGSDDAILEKELLDDLKRILAEREAIDITGEGKLGDEPGKAREYELTRYIQGLKDEREQLLELNPLYREYVRILQMKRRDMSGENALGKTEADRLEAEARAQYRLTEATKLVTDTYASLYDWQKKLADTPFGEEEIAKAVQELRGKFTDAGNTADDLELIELATDLHKAGIGVEYLTGTFDTLRGVLEKTTPEIDSFGVFVKHIEKLEALAGFKFPPDILRALELAGRMGISDPGEVLKKANLYLGGPQIDETSALSYSAQQTALALANNRYNAQLQAGAPGAFGAYQNDRNRINDSYYSEFAAGYGVSYSGMSGVSPQVSPITGRPTSGTYSTMDRALMDAADAKAEYNKALAGGDPGEIAAAQSAWEKQEQSLKKVIVAYNELNSVASQFKELAISTAVSALDESFYALGKNIGYAGKSTHDYEDAMRTLGKQMLQQIPMILLQASANVFTQGGPWQLGLALLAAGVGGSFLNGILGTKEDLEEDTSNDDYLKMLQNLQEQFKIMIDQFEASLLYLDVARAKYVADAQAASISTNANGAVFAQTSLSQGVYTNPTFFRHYAAGGVGMFAENGEEAIMPLSRMSNGKLGVLAEGGADTTVTIVVQQASGVQVREGGTQTVDGIQAFVLIAEQAAVGAITKGSADSALQSRFLLQKRGRG